MRIAVTGGAGFIGAHLVDRLVDEGHQVMVLDNFSTGNRDFLNPSVRVEEIDIVDVSAVRELFFDFKPETVFHCAAMIDLRKSFDNPELGDAVNIGGTQSVIAASEASGARQVIFSSSAAVYAPGVAVPISESATLAPASPYGAAKLKGEEMLRRSPLSTVALRYANVYGPRQGTVGEGGVIAIFSKKLLTGDNLTIFGDGEQTRDFVYVDDIVEANLRAMRAPEGHYEYNVGTSQETSINEIVENLLHISRKNSIVKHLKSVDGEVLKSSLANDLIARELDWNASVLIREGLARTWKWFEEQYI